MGRGTRAFFFSSGFSPVLSGGDVHSSTSAPQNNFRLLENRKARTSWFESRTLRCQAKRVERKRVSSGL